MASWPPEAQAVVRLLLARNAQLEARVEESKREWRSSRPDSTRTLRIRRCRLVRSPTPQPNRTGSPRSKRKRGGQPGHPKAERELIPTEQCQSVVRACRRSAGSAVGSWRVWIPISIDIRSGSCRDSTTVIEYQQHTLACRSDVRLAGVAAGGTDGSGRPAADRVRGPLDGLLPQSKRRAAQFLGTILNQRRHRVRTPVLQHHIHARSPAGSGSCEELGRPPLRLAEAGHQEARERGQPRPA